MLSGVEALIMISHFDCAQCDISHRECNEAISG